MIEADESKTGPDVAEYARIEQEGGWRLFMKAPTSHRCRINTKSRSQIRKYPRTALAEAFLLAKIGNPKGARDRLEALQPLVGAFDDASLDADIVLVDTHIRVYEDRPLNDAASKRLTQLLLTLPSDDRIGQALAFNHLSTAALHRGEFDRAQDHAENAIRLYDLGEAQFGSLHMHTHLGQIRMMRGDLTGAITEYDQMEASLVQLQGDPQGLKAICQALKSEVAYEMNELSAAQTLLDSAMVSIEGSDAWLDVLAATYRVRARLSLVKAGLPGALTDLAHADTAARARNMPRLVRLMSVERIRALTLSDEIGPALEEMGSIGLEPNKLDAGQPEGDWGLRHGTTNVAIARWLVRAHRPKRALDFVDLAEEVAIRGGQLLSLAKLRVIRAQAFWQSNARRDATSALLSAIRLLDNQPFRRFILDEGTVLQPVVQAALDGDHVAVPINAAQRRQLSEIMLQWTAGTLKSGESDTFDSQLLLHRRYLELLAQGHSNKEIGRVMGVSINTVKYHLKQIFTDLHADNRARAVNQARVLGIIDD